MKLTLLNHGVVWLRFFSFLSFPSLLIISCTKTDYLRVDPLTKAEISQIHKIGIISKTGADFDVVISRATANPKFYSHILSSGGDPAELFGVPLLLGLDLFIASAKYSADESIEDDLSPLLENYNPENVLAEKLVGHLELSKMFDQAEIAYTEDLTLLRNDKFDAVLEINIEKWGLSRCSDPAFGENWKNSCKHESLKSLSTATEICPPINHVSAMLITKGRIFLVDNNSTAWEQYEPYFDSKCETLDNLRNKEGLLVDFLNSAMDRYASMTVHEIQNSE